MQTVTIEGRQGASRLLVGGRLDDLPQHVPLGKTVILTDQRVLDLYGQRFPPVPVVTIPPGEAHKTLASLESIYGRLVELEADRASVLVGIGGGIVCDVAGFAASTYLRGIRFGFVATTLLAQVDASVGGKNGVNFGGYKNMVGVFNQPAFVICDLELLKTLPPEQVQCGMAEIVKHGAIADAGLFAFLEENAEAAAALQPDVVERLVGDSVRIKAGVVNRDEREQGERRKLNFGHTFGHAVEKTTGVAHGQAVSVGMVIAAVLSVRRGMLARTEALRLVRLLQRVQLPVALAFDAGRALDALRRDKKREGDRLHFVLLETLGGAVVETVPLDELEAVLPLAADPQRLMAELDG